MASTVGHAVPLLGPRHHDGFRPPPRMHTLIRIYKYYRYFRPSRLVLFIVALIIIWRYHVVYKRLQEDYVKSLEKSFELESTLLRGWLDRDRPTIYAITPTFSRPAQKAELTRLAQTFTLVPKFHWIIVEDAAEKTDLVSNFLSDPLYTFEYTHLNALTPSNYKLGKNDPNWIKPRGVEQRNAALNWIRKNVNFSHSGVVFFADDDNTYSIKLFDEMIKIKNVGVWPVGLVGGLMVEKPLCDNATKRVLGFNSMWKPDRPFPIDMAGFAINVQLIINHPNALFSFDVPRGYQESEILRQLITREDLEPLADFCTKVYVWHTRTEQPVMSSERILKKKGLSSNLGIEV